MNVMLKKAIEFAENLEGKATQDKVDEFHHLIRRVISEVENTAKVNHPTMSYTAVKCEFESMVVLLLFKMLFNKEKQNRTVELVISNLKS